MRVKRQKTNRRTIRFYKTCCGFREPFKVLCDGTFLHHLLTHKMGPPNDHLARLLSAPSRPFITRCVIAELKKLGPSFSDTLLAARKLDSAKCNHEPLKPGSDCLESLVGEGNLEHFWVATQDLELRIKLRKVPAVAIILAQNNFLVLEPPSEKQQGFVHTREIQRTHASKQELEVLEAQDRKKAAARRQLEDQATEASGEDLGAEPNSFTANHSFQESLSSHKRKKSLMVKDLPQFKKKRAKGPNPLSCKRKKTPSSSTSTVSVKKHDSTRGDGEKMESPIIVKQRHHHKKKKKVPHVAP